ncbi:hypothetical protein LCGC14_2071390 [marine sediment metagenome]|uniref:Uncharacterized protein n=1 Tax=marine sediment metagenome TaxID=412755 RepID=A0A0F9GWS0_9ZZZZ
MERLYQVSILKTSYHFVRCTAEEMAEYLSFWNQQGRGGEILATEINLSDFDEINHQYLC